MLFRTFLHNRGDFLRLFLMIARQKKQQSGFCAFRPAVTRQSYFPNCCFYPIDTVFLVTKEGVPYVYH
jgi:hypothetical protein